MRGREKRGRALGFKKSPKPPLGVPVSEKPRNRRWWCRLWSFLKKMEKPALGMPASKILNFPETGVGNAGFTHFKFRETGVGNVGYATCTITHYFG